MPGRSSSGPANFATRSAELDARQQRLEGDVDIVAKELPRDGCLGRSPLARGLVNMELRRGDRTLGTLLAVQSGLAMNAIDLLGSDLSSRTSVCCRRWRSSTH
jgi:hypothetical protein